MSSGPCYSVEEGGGKIPAHPFVLFVPLWYKFDVPCLHLTALSCEWICLCSRTLSLILAKLNKCCGCLVKCEVYCYCMLRRAVYESKLVNIKNTTNIKFLSMKYANIKLLAVVQLQVL